MYKIPDIYLNYYEDYIDRDIREFKLECNIAEEVDIASIMIEHDLLKGADSYTIGNLAAAKLTMKVSSAVEVHESQEINLTVKLKAQDVYGTEKANRRQSLLPPRVRDLCADHHTKRNNQLRQPARQRYGRCSRHRGYVGRFYRQPVRVYIQPASLRRDVGGRNIHGAVSRQGRRCGRAKHLPPQDADDGARWNTRRGYLHNA